MLAKMLTKIPLLSGQDKDGMLYLAW